MDHVHCRLEIALSRGQKGTMRVAHAECHSVEGPFGPIECPGRIAHGTGRARKSERGESCHGGS